MNEMMNEWMKWWNENSNEKKWKPTKFFGIVEYGVVNEFEKLLYEKWTKNHAGIEIWSIEKIPVGTWGLRVKKFMLDSNPECFPVLN